MTKHDVKLIMVSGGDVTGCDQAHCKLSCQVSLLAVAQTLCSSLLATLSAAMGLCAFDEFNFKFHLVMLLRSSLSSKRIFNIASTKFIKRLENSQKRRIYEERENFFLI